MYMIRVLLGDNFYQIKAEIDKLVSEFKSSHDFAVERIDGAESRYEQIVHTLQSVSMFDPKKLVIINDLSKNKKAMDEVDNLLQNKNESTDVVIIEKTLDKRSAYYKYLKRLDGFKEYKDDSEQNINNWIKDYVNQQDGEINVAEARLLIDKVGPSQTLISKELDKLIQFNKKITKDSIDKLVVENPQSTIFNLIDSTFSGNLKQSLKLYDEQRAQKIEPLAIVGMIIWQVHIICLCLAAGSRSTGEIAKESGINPYVVEKSRKIANKMGANKAKEFLNLLREIELTAKKQAYNLDDALKLALIKIAN